MADLIRRYNLLRCRCCRDLVWVTTLDMDNWDHTSFVLVKVCYPCYARLKRKEEYYRNVGYEDAYNTHFDKLVRYSEGRK